MCSNAVASANVNTAFASENANTAFALAFDCPVMDAFALAFDSSAFAVANKCESNATVLLLFYNVYFLSWFHLEYASGRSVQNPLNAVSESAQTIVRCDNWSSASLGAGLH